MLKGCCSPVYAAGKVFVDNMLSPLIVRSHFMPSLIEVVSKMVGFTQDGSDTNHVVLIKIPPMCHLSTYEELYTLLAEKGYVPIALAKYSSSCSEWFVHTCPPKGTTVYPTDMVYVITPMLEEEEEEENQESMLPLSIDSGT